MFELNILLLHMDRTDEPKNHSLEPIFDDLAESEVFLKNVGISGQ